MLIEYDRKARKGHDITLTEEILVGVKEHWRNVLRDIVFQPGNKQANAAGFIRLHKTLRFLRQAKVAAQDTLIAVSNYSLPQVAMVQNRRGLFYKVVVSLDTFNSYRPVKLPQLVFADRKYRRGILNDNTTKLLREELINHLFLTHEKERQERYALLNLHDVKLLPQWAAALNKEGGWLGTGYVALNDEVVARGLQPVIKPVTLPLASQERILAAHYDKLAQFVTGLDSVERTRFPGEAVEEVVSISENAAWAVFAELSFYEQAVYEKWRMLLSHIRAEERYNDMIDRRGKVVQKPEFVHYARGLHFGCAPAARKSVRLCKIDALPTGVQLSLQTGRASLVSPPFLMNAYTFSTQAVGPAAVWDRCRIWFRKNSDKFLAEAMHSSGDVA